MKGSNATSATGTAAAVPSGRSSAKPRSTLTSGDSFALAGPSRHPDPAYHAYRQDLADVALAGAVIASHYAAPLARVIIAATDLCDSPSADAVVIRRLAPGDSFALLDDTLGWAWGYAGDDRRVGYVTATAVGPA